MKAINDAVFLMVAVGTLVGLVGLFASRTAYVGLGLISLGPPVVGFAVHCYYWPQLPGNEPTGGLSRRLRWRWHHWRRMRGKAPERELEFSPNQLDLESDFSLQVRPAGMANTPADARLCCTIAVAATTELHAHITLSMIVSFHIRPMMQSFPPSR
jgi:hypothetical protein